MVAENGGAEAEAQARYLARGLCWNERIKGAFRTDKSGTGVSHQNLYYVPLGSGLQADGLGVGFAWSQGGALTVRRFNGKLQAVEYGLAQLLGMAKDAGQRRGYAQPEVNGTLQELGAVKLFHVG